MIRLNQNSGFIKTSKSWYLFVSFITIILSIFKKNRYKSPSDSLVGNCGYLLSVCVLQPLSEFFLDKTKPLTLLGRGFFTCNQSSYQYSQDTGSEDTVKSAGTAD